MTASAERRSAELRGEGSGFECDSERRWTL